MAVDYVNEITGRDGSEDIDTNKRYRRVFIGRTTVPQDGASVVLAALAANGITFNASYQYTDDSDPIAPVVVTDDSAVVIDIQVTQDNKDDPCDWRVVVQYAGVDDPVSQPAEVEFSPTRYQKSLVVDLTNDPVVNTAGCPFESGITVDRTRFTLTISKPALTWDAVAAAAYNDSLNEIPFLQVQFPEVTGAGAHAAGFPAQTCKLNWGAKRMRQQGTLNFYWMVTAVIDIDLNGWQPQVRDAGYQQLVTDPGTGATKLGPIFMQGGIQVSQPWPLSNGKAIAPGSPIPAPLTFQGYSVLDWTPLNLGF